jgi:hypothetical protein
LLGAYRGREDEDKGQNVASEMHSQFFDKMITRFFRMSGFER